MLTEDTLCPVGLTLKVIGGKWKILIIWHLRQGPRRFGDLRNAVDGISDKMLTQSLKELQMDGVITRKAYRQIPPRVEYSLSGSGWSLMRIVEGIAEWGVAFTNRHPNKAADFYLGKMTL